RAGTCDQVGGVITGDWTITTAQVCTGIVYSVDGSININSGGSLTLVNGGLSFSKDTSHEGYALNVNAGGELVLDNSIVTTQTDAINPFLKLAFTVSGAGSHFAMKNGAIVKFPGWFNATGATIDITGSRVTGFSTTELFGLDVAAGLRAAGRRRKRLPAPVAPSLDRRLDRVPGERRDDLVHPQSEHDDRPVSGQRSLHDAERPDPLVPREGRERRERVEPHGCERGRHDPAVHGRDHDRQPPERGIVRQLPADRRLWGDDRPGRRGLRSVSGDHRGQQHEAGLGVPAGPSAHRPGLDRRAGERHDDGPAEPAIHGIRPD